MNRATNVKGLEDVRRNLRNLTFSNKSKRNPSNQSRLMKAPRKRRSSQGFVTVTCLVDLKGLRESASKVRDVTKNVKKGTRSVKRAANATSSNHQTRSSRFREEEVLI